MDSDTKPKAQSWAALTRKHLRRDQAAAKKTKVVVTDSIKERQVRELRLRLGVGFNFHEFHSKS